MNQPNIAWGWAETQYHAPWHEPLFALICKYVPQESLILEVGAGGSHTLAALSGRHHCKAIGVEPDDDGISKVLEFADYENTSVQIVRGDGNFLPFESGTFDAVYSLGLVEHFSREIRMNLLSEHRRVLRKGGVAIVSVPNWLNFPHTVHKYLLGSNYQFHPEQSFTPGQLKKMLRGVGFSQVDSDGLLPLWGFSMYRSGWRITSLLDKSGVSRRLQELRSPKLRGMCGYMTVAIAVK